MQEPLYLIRIDKLLGTKLEVKDLCLKTPQLLAHLLKLWAGL